MTIESIIHNPKRTMVLVDADSLVFRAALKKSTDIKWDGEEAPGDFDIGGATREFESRLTELRKSLGVHGFPSDVLVLKLCFTGRQNFRKQRSTTYKAQRKPSPPNVGILRDAILSSDAYKPMIIIEPELEADDLLGIYSDPDRTIIVSEDKDLLQLPGVHWNYSKPEQPPVFIDEFEGYLRLLRQMLIGDRCDNVAGIFRMGPVKAKALIEKHTSLPSLLDTIEILHKSQKTDAQHDLLMLYVLHYGESKSYRIDLVDFRERLWGVEQNYRVMNSIGEPLLWKYDV